MGSYLNLARQYRVVSFNDIIGQELVVRMLQNSLFANQIFPVYLMSGKHGCGKTSVGRIFASAVNCFQIDQFRANPKLTPVPCLSCASCLAMMNGGHPDYIEVDAASHTGVDVIRGLIDSASFLPLMGRSKIYLIDEAHMLSKAAFNALLKILEEPPKTVFFILATTDIQKIPETVRSRCFQLLFKPVNHDILKDYLEKICTKTSLSYTDVALNGIVNYSGGSVRDALNVIERLRHSFSVIDEKAVKEVMGFIEDSLLLEMIEATWDGNLNYFQERFFHVFSSHVSINLVWERLIIVLHKLLTYKLVAFSVASDLIKTLSKKVSIIFLNTFLKHLFDNEPLLLKTSNPLILLHTIVLKNIKQNDTSALSPANSDIETNTVLDISDSSENNVNNTVNQYISLWQLFIKKITEFNDPVITSLFVKVRPFITLDPYRLDLLFGLNEFFLQELLVAHQNRWQPLLVEVFGSEIIFSIRCSDCNEKNLSESLVHCILNNDIIVKNTNLSDRDSNHDSFVNKKPMDNASILKLTPIATALKYFPGRVLFFES